MRGEFFTAPTDRSFSHSTWPRLIGAGIAAIAALLALAPLASLVVIALSAEPDIWPHLAAYVLPHAFQQTMLLLAGVAVIAGVGGVGTAWVVTTFQFPARTALTWLLPLPLAVPTYIVAYVYVDLLDGLGPVQRFLRFVFGWQSAADYWFPNVRSLPGAILLFGFVLYPYVYLATRAVLQTQSAAFGEAARVSGARPWELMHHITLPLARPAIAVGIALTLLETLNDIGASEYLGVQTLTLSIFTTWLNRGSLAGAAQIACLMLILVAALVLIERHGRRHRSYATSGQRPQPASRIALSGARGLAASLFCLAPVVLGFGIPAAVLLREVIGRGLLTGFDTELIDHTLTTLIYAATATAIVLTLGFSAAEALRFLRRRFVAFCVQVASIGYAVPGTVLALGLLTPLVLADDAINWLVEALSGAGIGLIIAGSGIAVVTAYVVRFLAIGVGFAQAGLGGVPRELDDSARIFGANPVTVVRTIHLPLARPAIWGAALLIFVDCLKELPATLLLRPLNVETLSTYIYQYAVRGNFEAGALAALLIVAVGIYPVIRIARHADLAIEAARSRDD